MDALASSFSFAMFTMAATANIFLVARSIGLPMDNVSKLLNSSILITVLFLFSFSYSINEKLNPALLGTLAYIFLESEGFLKEWRKQPSGRSEEAYSLPTDKEDSYVIPKPRGGVTVL